MVYFYRELYTGQGITDSRHECQKVRTLKYLFFLGHVAPESCEREEQRLILQGKIGFLLLFLLFFIRKNNRKIKEERYRLFPRIRVAHWSSENPSVSNFNPLPFPFPTSILSYISFLSLFWWESDSTKVRCELLPLFTLLFYSSPFFFGFSAGRNFLNLYFSLGICGAKLLLCLYWVQNILKPKNIFELRI